jgi:heat shock protein HslJ
VRENIKYLTLIFPVFLTGNLYIYTRADAFQRMKLLTACMVTSAFLLILMAGCATLPAPGPGSPMTPVTPATSTPTPAPAPLIDPSLAGTWYLKMMAEQGGSALVDTMSPQITAVFTNQSNVLGFSGCNNYNGQYMLTGQVLPDGKGITIGPLSSSTMYCATMSGTETTYLQILQAAKSYTVNVNQELTIVDKSGNSLVYQRTPYSSTFVPKGI